MGRVLAYHGHLLDGEVDRLAVIMKHGHVVATISVLVNSNNDRDGGF